MSKKNDLKETLQKEKTNLQKEISSLKKVMSDYKVERKTNWKIFKNKMNDDIDKIEKSLSKQSNNNKK
jgi:hypothetical protein